jgi:type IV pilus assembly protein PilA
MKRCPVCNAAYSPDHAFCTVDGAALGEAPEVAAGVPQPLPPGWPQPVAKRRVPVWVWILLGVGAFFILIVLPLLALLVIPTLSAAKKTANEHAAIKSIQTIQVAETMYSSTYPDSGYTCSLAALGGDSSAGAPSPTAAQLLRSDLTSGNKDGYIFTIGNCTKMTVNGSDRITSFTVTAVPQTVGKTGNRGFCGDENDAITFDPDGGSHCTQPLR